MRFSQDATEFELATLGSEEEPEFDESKRCDGFGNCGTSLCHTRALLVSACYKDVLSVGTCHWNHTQQVIQWHNSAAVARKTLEILMPRMEAAGYKPASFISISRFMAFVYEK